MSYYPDKSVKQQVKELLAASPQLSYKEAVTRVTRDNTWSRSNAVRPRLQGSSEVARRKRQVAKGIIKVL